MIKVGDIKPFPCMDAGGVAVVVETSGASPEVPTEVNNASINAAISQNPAATRGALNLADAIPNIPLGPYAEGASATTTRTGSVPGSNVMFNHPNFGEVVVLWGDSFRSVYGSYGIRLGAHADITWSDESFGSPTSPPTTGLTRPSAGQIEATLSTGGRSDFLGRDFSASRYIRPGSYTVAVAEALITPPDGAMIHVSDDAGGATNAQYARGAWRRIYDDAPISD